jgi:hypothetical protein
MTSFLPSVFVANATQPLFAFIDELPRTVFLVAGMGFVLGIILIGAVAKAQKEKLRHDTLRRALEKGQPLPPELLEEKARSHPRDDRRGGLVSLAVGVGVFVFFRAMHESEPDIPAGVAWMGCIPALVGVALLLNWALDRRGKNDQSRS